VIPRGDDVLVVRLADPAGTDAASVGDTVAILAARPGARRAAVLAARARVVGLPADPSGAGGLLLVAVPAGEALALAAAGGDRLSVAVPAPGATGTTGATGTAGTTGAAGAAGTADTAGR
jgi:pilus assembly protein FimV